ncbi:MAG: hypothetical protein M1548_01960, partial [Actinobacteria bacterium]|nr:hypothetical protein [Actinomycetota bacterium]
MDSMFFQQTAAWKKKTGQDEFGKPTFAAATNIKVRWEPRQRIVANQAGKQVVSTAEIFCLEAIAACLH